MGVFIAFSQVRLKADTTSLRGCIDLSTTRATQNVLHRIVRLVARVLEDLLVRCRPREFASPWPDPRARVLHREAIQQRVVGDAREALDDVQVLTRSLQPILRLRAKTLDHEQSPPRCGLYRVADLIGVEVRRV